MQEISRTRQVILTEGKWPQVGRPGAAKISDLRFEIAVAPVPRGSYGPHHLYHFGKKINREGVGWLIHNFALASKILLFASIRRSAF
jgi:hypothetical protein